MKRQLLLCTLLGFMAGCQQDRDIQPSSLSLADKVAGNYQTNFYLDLSCVAIPANKMPSAVLQAESDSTVTLVYSRYYPANEVHQIKHIRLKHQAETIQFLVADSSIGSLQPDRIFTNNGMEKQGDVLRINVLTNTQDPIYFLGYKL